MQRGEERSRARLTDPPTDRHTSTRAGGGQQVEKGRRRDGKMERERPPARETSNGRIGCWGVERYILTERWGVMGVCAWWDGGPRGERRERDTKGEPSLIFQVECIYAYPLSVWA